jgi:uncharacterized protein YjbI with pentapeptide repeats
MSTQCTHSFTPEYPDYPECKHKGDDNTSRERWLLSEEVPGVSDGTWSCPHESVSGYDKCVFHLPVADRPSDIDATEAFLEAVAAAADLDTRTQRRRQVQFIDAEFESFDIAGERLETGASNYINLAHATIPDANFGGTVIDAPIRFPHARFTGESNFLDAQFNGLVGLRGTIFSGTARFKGATFNRPISAKHARFEEAAYFWHTVFKRHAIFYHVDFEGYAYFRGVDFDNYVRFSEAHFHDEAWFELGEFGDDADFIETRFEGPHSFVAAEFERTTNFSEVIAAGEMDLTDTHIENLVMTPERIPNQAQYVDLSDSVIESGELGQPEEGNILYDAHQATLGDVDVTAPSAEPTIDRIRLVSTDYDGFEFENDDMEPQTSQWRIHEVFDASLLPESRRGELSPEVKRDTYLKAKNGAKQAGNTTATGQFYYKEMSYRRKHMADLFIEGNSNRLQYAMNWLKNSALNVTTGYGEYPLRVVGFSFLTVLGFGGLYNSVAPAGTPIEESLLFSFQSFITFIVGSPAQETTRIATFASIVEGFIGAFFIALFVYTFTRRLNR